MSQQKIANPAPLGLAGFGFTTVLLNLVNAGLIDKSLEMSFILTMGIFFGGLCQLIAGQWAFKLGEVFPATAFTSYGAFWETFALYLFIGPVMGWIGTPPKAGVAAYMFLWGIFTFYMWINSFYHNWNLLGVFGTLWILFLLLGAHFALDNNLILRIAGYEGILCGFWAVWTSFTIIFVEHTGVELPGMGTPLE